MTKGICATAHKIVDMTPQQLLFIFCRENEYHTHSHVLPYYFFIDEI